jgi:hypothetical protein
MAQQKRDAEAEALRLAIRDRERQRAYWTLRIAMERVQGSIGNPHIVDARALKDYRDALERARRSMKD